MYSNVDLQRTNKLVLELFLKAKNMTKQIPPFRIKFLRPKTPACTMGACIRSVTIFVDSVKIISIRPEPQVIKTSPLQLYFFKIGSTSTGNSTKFRLKATIPFFLLKINSRLFSNQILENPSCLWLASRSTLSEILNINKRKYKIRLFNYNISNLS